MVKVLTPNLRAISTVRSNTAGFDSRTIDLTVRPPVGVIISAVLMKTLLNSVAGLAATEYEAAQLLSLNEDRGNFSGVFSFNAVTDDGDDNSDVIAYDLFQMDGQQSASGAAAGQQMGQWVTFPYWQFPLLERPIVFGPMRHGTQRSGGIENISTVMIIYTLAEFESNEIAAVLAAA